MPFVRLSSLASLSLALSLPSGPSSLLVSAQTNTNNVYNGFEYAIEHVYQNWEDHEKAAVAWGGHLASVHSKEEYEFILNLRDRNDRYFLGGMRIRGGSTWSWSDGSPWDFEDWAEDEPNNRNDMEDRVEIKKNNLWNDVESTSDRMAIYKKRVSARILSTQHHPLFSDNLC